MENTITRRNFLKSTAVSGAAVIAGTAGKKEDVSLKALSKGILPLGVAVRTPVNEHYTGQELDLIRKHFSIITPEDSMKWPFIEHKEGELCLDAADNLIAFAQKNKQKVLGHTLLFNRNKNYPAWVFMAGDRKASAHLVEKKLRTHIDTLMKKYKGKIYAWDVVNEAVEEKEPYYRETDWFKTFGKEFVPMAFRMAKKADPGALLIYNDFRVEVPRKLEQVLLLLDELKEKSALPDVVGIQGHWEIDDVPFEHIEKAILALHEKGVRISITELDIDMMSRKKYWNMETRPEAVKQNPYTDRCPADVLKRQAEQYAELFRLFVKHKEKMERVTFWGFTDGISWLNTWPWKRTNHALLFDRNAEPKPAFYAIADVLKKAK